MVSGVEADFESPEERLNLEERSRRRQGLLGAHAGGFNRHADFVTVAVVLVLIA